jgi:hypothetical protein
MQDDIWKFFLPVDFEELTYRYREAVHDSISFNYADTPIFIFTEEVSDFGSIGGLDGPNGSALCLGAAELEGRQTRYRASGVRASHFLARLPKFRADLSSVDPSDQERQDRHDELVAFFEERPIRRFDIYVGQEDTEARAIRATLLPTSWMAIGIGPQRPPGAGRPIFHSEDEDIPGGEVRADWLRWIAPISPPLELRLRDIFSLNHIGNAGPEGLSGPFPSIGPDDDDGGGLGGDRFGGGECHGHVHRKDLL